MNFRRFRKEKSQEALKREILSRSAKEQFKKLNHFGLSFPVAVWQV